MLPVFEFLRDILFCAGYLSGGEKSFPKQLSPEEENRLLEKYTAGDESAREQLIVHNLRLVAHIAKKYARNSADADDFISIGTIGLIKGINTFRTDKGKLSTYISKCIENEILMYLRSAKKTQCEVSLGESLGEDKEGNQLSFLDILCTDENEVSDQVTFRMQVESLSRILTKVLTPREFLVIRLRYGLCGSEVLPQRVIAERLGISRSYISRIEKRALEKLKKNLLNQQNTVKK